MNILVVRVSWHVRFMIGLALALALMMGRPAPASAAVIATFSPAGTLTVFGDALANTIQSSRNAAGQLLVNGGAVAVTGGTPTVANTALIQVFAQGDNDTVTFSEANGALPRGNLSGG